MMGVIELSTTRNTKLSPKFPKEIDMKKSLLKHQDSCLVGVNAMNQSPTLNLGGRDKKKKRKEIRFMKPKRPLNAYNFFFRYERARLLISHDNNDGTLDDERFVDPRENTSFEEKRKRVRELLENNPFFIENRERPHRKTHGKIGFRALAKHIADSWKTIEPETRAVFTEIASEDKERHRREMKEYLKRSAHALDADFLSRQEGPKESLSSQEGPKEEFGDSRIQMNENSLFQKLPPIFSPNKRPKLNHKNQNNLEMLDAGDFQIAEETNDVLKVSKKEDEVLNDAENSISDVFISDLLSAVTTNVPPTVLSESSSFSLTPIKWCHSFAVEEKCTPSNTRHNTEEEEMKSTHNSEEVEMNAADATVLKDFLSNLDWNNF